MTKTDKNDFFVPYLIGCGILEKEIRFLVKKNGWKLEQTYLPSGLHTDFEKLDHTLNSCLSKHRNGKGIVFYGTCHPCMDEFIANSNSMRTVGQNCVDIYLGHENFCRELEQGAFFLFEDWAIHWKKIVGGVMPGNPQIMKDIFRSAHRYLLAIRTPLSKDFTKEAELVSNMTSLPVRWFDADMEHLEKRLSETYLNMENKI